MEHMKNINESITSELQQKAAQLLESGEVAAFIGFTKGSHPMATRPIVIRNPEDAKKLVWNSFCVLNLANYLPQTLKSVESENGSEEETRNHDWPKVGIAATGCCSRNIVVQVQENQVDKDRIVVLGITSRGMVDKKKVASKVLGKEIREIIESDHSLKVKGPGFETEIPRWDVIRDNCLCCTRPEPTFFHYKIESSSNVERRIENPFSQVDELEALSQDERWKWFIQEIDQCIRCYACRNVCPLCYCPTCFVDDSRPQWVGKSVDKSDTAIFHILRAYHCAGRCTDCGACESACPMGIKMRIFTKKLQKDVLELFGTEAGIDFNTPPPLSTYSTDDPEDFVIDLIKGGPKIKKGAGS